MRELLLNRTRFTDYLSTATSPEAIQEKLRTILQNIESMLAGNTRPPATIKLGKTSNGDAIYNHESNTITIPYRPGVHGLYYYSNLIHEDSHADQTYGQRDAIERLLLEISRAIYPTEGRVAKENGDPTNEYLYNYGELHARCAEIQAINEAFLSRIKAVPPDCNIIEKDEMLKVMRDTWSILHHQQSKFGLYLTRLQNIQSVLTKDYDHSIMPCSMTKAALFLATTAPSLYNEKFKELQQAIQTFRTNMQSLRTWTLPQNRQITQEAERSAMERYVEQEHQKVLQCVKSSGAHYNEFPPQDANIEVMQLASDRLLQWYLDAHHEEAGTLYIVPIDANSKEHSYIAHRILPDDNVPDTQLESDLVFPPDISTNKQEMEVQDNNEIDWSCL